MADARRRILFIIPTLRCGGAERVMTTLLKHLDRRRFKLTLAVVNTSKAVFMKEIPEDIDLVDMNAGRVLYAIPKVIALIWKIRPDVVFSTLGHLNLALAMVRWLLPDGVRTIARETAVISQGLQSYRTPVVWTILYRLFYRNHNLVLCQSCGMQTDLVDRFKFPVKKTTVINNPLDLEHVRKLSKAHVRYPVTRPEDIRLIAAGRFGHEKGFDLLIKAIALLNDPKVHLVLLGEGPLKDALQQLANDEGVAEQVHFAGFQSNPYAWFAKADAFVLASRHEGFPNVVLEALACGTPVIATPAPGGVREILENVPESVVAAAVSAEALAAAIVGWLAGPRRRVPEIAVEPYRVDRIVEQYEKLLAQ